jgi:hypothetical protein
LSSVINLSALDSLVNLIYCFVQMTDEDAIGVVRAHRWATLAEQRQRLKADGCRVVIDLGETPRDALLPMIREGTVVKAAYAFLLAERKGATAGLADYHRLAERLAKLPRGCVGWVKDLETGLVAHTPGTRKAMLAVVKDQLARHGKGLRSAENGKRGGQLRTFTETQMAKAEAVWNNVKRYPTWEDAAKALPEGFSVWRAHKLWQGRR